MDHCPICKKSPDVYWEIDVDKPFTAMNPEDGLTIWGPYDSPKEVLCFNGLYIHFRFGDKEERLVRLMKGKYQDPIVQCPKCKGKGMVNI